jgi:glycerophosphoryl diester phosphodiesterase
MSADISWLTRRPIAHRGYHDLNVTRWENTLSAFEAAVNHNFSIECDVQLTADGQVVVFHDGTLERLTGGSGLVREKTAAELTSLFIGGTQDRMPRLTDMLDLVAGKVPVVLELKGGFGRDDRFVDAVVRALAGYKGNVAIMSFEHWLVRQFPIKAPNIPCGLTAEGTGLQAIEGHFSMLANCISFVSFDVNELPNPFVTFVRERLSMPVITWTVKDARTIEIAQKHADQMTFEGFDPDKLATS